MNTPKPFHLPLALGLLMLGFFLKIYARNADVQGTKILWLYLFALLIWFWGFTHLVFSQGLDSGFVALGLFSILGVIILIWVVNQKPR
jgi:hypothetical protein